jgi:hypothetical protein
VSQHDLNINSFKEVAQIILSFLNFQSQANASLPHQENPESRLVPSEKNVPLGSRTPRALANNCDCAVCETGATPHEGVFWRRTHGQSVMPITTACDYPVLRPYQLDVQSPN